MLLPDHADMVAEKIRISGGGRSNFRDEFDAFLKCGILGHGFLWLH